MSRDTTNWLHGLDFGFFESDCLLIHGSTLGCDGELAPTTPPLTLLDRLLCSDASYTLYNPNTGTVQFQQVAYRESVNSVSVSRDKEFAQCTQAHTPCKILGSPHSDQQYRRWSAFWIWLGPISGLLLLTVTGLLNRQAWGGLTAVLYGGPIWAIIHLIAPLALLILNSQRRRQGQSVSRRVRLGLLYYISAPIVLLLISVQVQGLSQTVAVFVGLFHEIRFQLNRLMS